MGNAQNKDLNATDYKGSNISKLLPLESYIKNMILYIRNSNSVSSSIEQRAEIGLDSDYRKLFRLNCEYSFAILYQESMLFCKRINNHNLQCPNKFTFLQLFEFLITVLKDLERVFGFMNIFENKEEEIFYYFIKSSQCNIFAPNISKICKELGLTHTNIIITFFAVTFGGKNKDGVDKLEIKMSSKYFNKFRSSNEKLNILIVYYQMLLITLKSTSKYDSSITLKVPFFPNTELNILTEQELSSILNFLQFQYVYLSMFGMKGHVWLKFLLGERKEIYTSIKTNSSAQKGKLEMIALIYNKLIVYTREINVDLKIKIKEKRFQILDHKEQTLCLLFQNFTEIIISLGKNITHFERIASYLEKIKKTGNIQYKKIIFKHLISFQLFKQDHFLWNIKFDFYAIKNFYLNNSLLIFRDFLRKAIKLYFSIRVNSLEIFFNSEESKIKRGDNFLQAKLIGFFTQSLKKIKIFNTQESYNQIHFKLCRPLDNFIILDYDFKKRVKKLNNFLNKSMYNKGNLFKYFSKIVEKICFSFSEIQIHFLPISHIQQDSLIREITRDRFVINIDNSKEDSLRIELYIKKLNEEFFKEIIPILESLRINNFSTFIISRLEGIQYFSNMISLKNLIQQFQFVFIDNDYDYIVKDNLLLINKIGINYYNLENIKENLLVNLSILKSQEINFLFSLSLFVEIQYFLSLTLDLMIVNYNILANKLYIYFSEPKFNYFEILDTDIKKNCYMKIHLNKKFDFLKFIKIEDSVFSVNKFLSQESVIYFIFTERIIENLLKLIENNEKQDFFIKNVFLFNKGNYDILKYFKNRSLFCDLMVVYSFVPIFFYNYSVNLKGLKKDPNNIKILMSDTYFPIQFANLCLIIHNKFKRIDKKPIMLNIALFLARRCQLTSFNKIFEDLKI
jgi:hypothetical protein